MIDDTLTAHPAGVLVAIVYYERRYRALVNIWLKSKRTDRVNPYQDTHGLNLRVHSETLQGQEYRVHRWRSQPVARKVHCER